MAAAKTSAAGVATTRKPTGMAATKSAHMSAAKTSGPTATKSAGAYSAERAAKTARAVEAEAA